MKTFVGLIAVIGVAASASASVLMGPGGMPLVNTVQAFAVPDHDVGGSTRAVYTYDNWNNPNSLLTSVFTAGTDEIADDLHMVGGGLLTNMGINVANSNGASNLTGGQLAVRFYNFAGGAFIGGFNANLPAISLAAGGSIRLQFADGNLDAFGFVLPNDVYCSLQINTSTWSGAGSNANIGFQTRAPINLGTSDDNMIDVTTNTNFAFGGNPLANTGLYVRVVPAPGAMALFGFGGLLAARRRR